MTEPADSNLFSLPVALPRGDLPASGTGRRAGRPERDLALVGRAALTLDPSRILDSLDEVLDLLCGVTGAGCAELFLLDPNGDELVQTLQRGGDAEAFAERSRFEVAAGYPGLAVETGMSVQTRRLQSDERFLRGRVKAAGYRSFIMIPLSVPQGVLGSLGLGWKRDDIDFERVGRLLAWLGRPVSTALLASAAIGGRQWHLGEPGLQERFKTLAVADEVTLVRLGARNDDRAGESSGDVNWDLQIPDCRPVRRAGTRVLLGDSTRWPKLCVARCGRAKVRYCLPLERNRELRGIVRVSYHDNEPRPSTRHLARSLGVTGACSVGAPSPLVGFVPPAATAPPPLEIRCFGGFEVLLSGEPLARSAFARKKAVDLLQLLALKPGRAVTGSQLARLLWPGVEPDSGKNRLHGVVYALRKALEPNKGKHTASWIVCQDDRYSLEPPDGASIDLWRFREKMAEARAAEASREPAEVVAAALREAVDLYRGELFAGGEETIWSIDPRSRYREQCVAALLRLDRFRRQLGGDDCDVSLLRRAVATDPLREDVHLQLIRTLLESGRRGDALAQYQTLVRVLHEELDAVPSAEARKLRRQLCDT